MIVTTEQVVKRRYIVTIPETSSIDLTVYGYVYREDVVSGTPILDWLQSQIPQAKLECITDGPEVIADWRQDGRS